MIILLMTIVLAAPLVSLDDPVRFLNAWDIGAACRDDENAVSSEICYTFLLGVAQTRDSLAHPATDHARFCLPDNITRRQLIGAVRRHIRRAPGALEAPADVFVMAAFTQAFPCD